MHVIIQILIWHVSAKQTNNSPKLDLPESREISDRKKTQSILRKKAPQYERHTKFLVIFNRLQSQVIN